MRQFLLQAALALAGVSIMWIPGTSSSEAGGVLPTPNEKVVYHCQTGSDGLCTMSPDGSERGSIDASTLTSTDPAISPDGRWIAYGQGLDDIYVMRTDGTDAHELFDDEGVFKSPTWSPDGNELAFTCELPGPPAFEGICKVNADGTQLQQVKEFEDPTYPRWSPDGDSMIIHHVETTVNEDMYILNLTNGNVVNITNTLEDEEYGSWSPDGEKIAFVGGPFPGENDLARNLYLIDPDGMNREMIFNPGIGAEASYPAWSPDGEEIAFVCDHEPGNAMEMCFIDVDTHELARHVIPDTNEMWSVPDWGAFSTFIDFGDVDCNRSINSVDALQVLRDTAGLPTNQEHPCPVIGEPFALPAGGGSDPLWGDVDCDEAVGSLDALKLLQSVAALPYGQTEPCPDIGTPLY